MLNYRGNPAKISVEIPYPPNEFRTKKKITILFAMPITKHVMFRQPGCYSNSMHKSQKIAGAFESMHR